MLGPICPGRTKKMTTPKSSYDTENTKEKYSKYEKLGERMFPKSQFENTSMFILCEQAALSEINYALFEKSLANYLSDKNSKEILRLVNDVKASMAEEFNENCKYNNIAAFDGSGLYAVYHKVLAFLYRWLWKAFITEKASYTEIDTESKVGIMDYIGSELTL